MTRRTAAGVHHVADAQLSDAERALMEMATRGELPELDPSTLRTREEGLDELHAVMEAAVGGPEADRKSTRLNSSHRPLSRMPSSA